MFLGIDTVSVSDVTCTLDSREGSSAKVRISGHVNGAIHGAATEIELHGHYLYYLTGRRISRVELTLKETRDGSPVGPGLEVTGQLSLNLTGLRSSRHLSDAAVARIPAKTN